MRAILVLDASLNLSDKVAAELIQGHIDKRRDVYEGKCEARLFFTYEAQEWPIAGGSSGRVAAALLWPRSPGHCMPHSLIMTPWNTRWWRSSKARLSERLSPCVTQLFSPASHISES
jgi:hypothetical protein